MPASYTFLLMVVSGVASSITTLVVNWLWDRWKMYPHFQGRVRLTDDIDDGRDGSGWG